MGGRVHALHSSGVVSIKGSVFSSLWKKRLQDLGDGTGQAAPGLWACMLHAALPPSLFPSHVLGRLAGSLRVGKAPRLPSPCFVSSAGSLKHGGLVCRCTWREASPSALGEHVVCECLRWRSFKLSPTQRAGVWLSSTTMLNPPPH